MAREERGREGRSEGGHRKPGKSDYKSRRSFSRNKSIREKSESSSGRGRDGARPDRSGKFKSGDRERFNRSGFKRDERPSRSDDKRKREWDKPKRDGSEGSGERKWSGDRDRSRKPGFRGRGDRDEKSYPAKREERSRRSESGEERKFDRDRPRRENRDDREEDSYRSKPRRESRDSDSNERPKRRSPESDNPRRERRDNTEFGRDDKRVGYKRRDTDDDRPRRRNFDDDYSERSGRGDRKSTYQGDRGDRPARGDRKYGDRDKDRSDSDVPKKEKGTAPARKQQKSEGEVRLNKYLASAGIASRREADTLISSGAVSVNGQVVTQLGFMVKPGDTVNYGGQSIKGERKVYLLLNKPKDYITTVDDPRDRKTVMHLIEGACKERVYPVGRLDRNTTGVLLLTNDGELTKRLTHPKFGIKKVYHVTLNKGLKTDDFKKIIEGVELEDGIIKADDLSFVGEGKKEVGIEIHSGRNRVVRRLFEHLGYDVIKLDRVVFAGLTKKDLSRGRHRFLTAKEIAFLKMLG